MAARPIAVRGWSSVPTTKASGSPATAGSAAGSQKRTGASWTSETSRGPNTKPARTMRAQYVTVSAAPTTATASSRTAGQVWPGVTSSIAVSIDSLDTKPRVGGMPAIAAAPRQVAPKVHGMRRHSGPSRRRSRVPASWSTTPTSMNSPDLNSACASVCRAAAARAAGVPMPIVATIQPSCETVEYAMSCLRSVFCRAKTAPITAVPMPAVTSSAVHAGVPAKAGEKRMSRKMPALTTAAACRYALTGVAAAIASGSQKWNGHWAALVIAATATSTPTTAVNVGSVCQTSLARISDSRVVPVRTDIATIAESSTRPPKNVTSSVRTADGYAERPALAMSAKDASEVSSQQTKSATAESVSTRPSIETVNTVMSW